MNDKLYKVLSKISRWLPSVGASYLALCVIWGLPLGDEINQTIAVAATLLATTLEIANGVYLSKKGE